MDENDFIKSCDLLNNRTSDRLRLRFFCLEIKSTAKVREQIWFKRGTKRPDVMIFGIP